MLIVHDVAKILDELVVLVTTAGAGRYGEGFPQ